jgi:hypothetical protein
MKKLLFILCLVCSCTCFGVDQQGWRDGRHRQAGTYSEARAQAGNFQTRHEGHREHGSRYHRGRSQGNTTTTITTPYYPYYGNYPRYYANPTPYYSFYNSNNELSYYYVDAYNNTVYFTYDALGNIVYFYYDAQSNIVYYR